MGLHRIFVGLLATCGLMGLGTASAALQFSTTEDVLRVWGKVDAGDVDLLKARLTPEIKTVVLTGVTGGDWTKGHDLGGLIESAGVTTVVHGLCGGWACPMMFLSGKQRMFNGVGRPEVHHLEFPFMDGNRAGYTYDGVSEAIISQWWHQHTKVSNSDLQIHHMSMFSSSGLVLDYLHFFPAQAHFSRGNVLHCSGELIKEKKKDHILADCLPVSDASALSKGIVTTDEPFTHSGLTIKPDVPALPASSYAKLEDAPDAKVGLSEECKGAYVRFLRYDSPRAFVVTNSGGCYAANAQAFQPHSQAMNSCSKAVGAKNCRFYAEDGDVVFVPFDQPLPTAAPAPVASKP